MNSLVNVKALTHFCFHFDLNIISHNLNDQVGAIIIAHHKMDDQIGAIERVDIYRQPLRVGLTKSTLKTHRYLDGSGYLFDEVFVQTN